MPWDATGVVIEDNEEVVEDIVESVMEQIEAQLQLGGSDDDDNDEFNKEEIFNRLPAGRAATEAWFRDLQAIASCKQEDDAILAITRKYFDSTEQKQQTLHSFFG